MIMKKKMFIAVILIMTLLLNACAANPKNSASDSSTPADSDESAYYETGEDYESYLDIEENNEQYTDENSMLTFSLKVDTASYSNVARYIENGSLPPADAVRTEELINYFSYDGEIERKNGPFAVSTEIGSSPFDENKYMAFIRVKTEEIDTEELPPSNLTFLIDTSGSMDSYDKLPLLKESFALLVENMDEDDRISIVTYAGSSAVVLDSADGTDKDRILTAINRLEASGSTAGADGILTAYKLAEKNYMENGNNRIILATDGDFNVGISDLDGLNSLISEKRDGGVYLSVLGFGTGNLKDDTMETLSANGNGNYLYIHSVADAQKGLVDELGSSLYTVADDVKAQVEFNSDIVKNYRLVGYENRQMSNKDFSDDTKDAGEIGAGTDVVAMFELELNEGGGDDNLFEVRIRYKDPGETESRLFTTPAYYSDISAETSQDFGFACAVAGFGHILRDSDYIGDLTLNQVMGMAANNLGQDNGGYRRNFLELLERYRKIVTY